MTSGYPILMAPAAKADARGAERIADPAQTVTYKGFVIAARPYQLHDSGRWTVEVDLRRDGQRRSFSAQETCRTCPEAEALCFSVGRRIIDGKLPGWSVDQLRGAPDRWPWLRHLVRSWTRRPLLAVSAFALCLAAFLLLEGSAFPPGDPPDTAGLLGTVPHPAPLWMASAGLMTGALLVVAAARRTP